MSNKYVNTPIGFARLNREPLEKYEEFNSVYDAMQYLKTGPCYDGQIITVVHHKSIIQKFIVKRNGTEYRLELDINSNEPSIISYDNSKWLLVYYRNPGSTLFNANTAKYSVDDPFNFSILGCLDMFWNSSNKLDFLLYKGTVLNRFNQPFNPLTMKNSSGTTVSASGTKVTGNVTYISGTCPISDNSGSYVKICPNASNSDIVKLYVNIDKYLS